MSKTHFEVKVAFSTETVASCGTNGRKSGDVYRVDCKRCAMRDAYILAKDEADLAKHAALMAQEPSTFKEPWQDKTMCCSNCGGFFFRYGNRTCYGHYQNYLCAKCGHVESRLTETGMSF